MKEFLRKILPLPVINFYHLSLSFLGALINFFPSSRIRVIGVTGTNGKSTVVYLIEKILEQSGYRVASLSSIKFKIDKKERANDLRMTMPGRFFIQKFLRQAVKAGCTYAVVEVTSEGIVQSRHRFISFDSAVFTNLSLEHIESHKGFDNYRKAKLELFKKTKNIHVLNLDDENIEYFLSVPCFRKYGYTLNNLKENLKDLKIKITQGKNARVGVKGVKFSVNGVPFNLKLLGEFNIYNALAAVSVSLAHGISLQNVKKALERIQGIPGRMEQVLSSPFKVFVDYAFTPNALEKVYKTLKKDLKTGKFICVFGAAGGGRDKWKRPVLGKIAAENCDKIIITNEDPYDEDEKEILKMIKTGITKAHFSYSHFQEILDRREAIARALALAKKKDLVIITGKGCESSICLKHGKRIPFDDRKVVREEMENLKKK